MSTHPCPRCREFIVKPHKWGDTLCIACCAIEGLELMDRKLKEAEEKGFTRGVEWLKTLAAEHGHTVTVGKMALKEAFYTFIASETKDSNES